MKKLIERLDNVIEAKGQISDAGVMVLAGIRSLAAKDFTRRAEKFLDKSENKSDDVKKAAIQHLQLIDKVLSQANTSLIAPTAAHISRFKKQLKKYAGEDVKESVDIDEAEKRITQGQIKIHASASPEKYDWIVTEITDSGARKTVAHGDAKSAKDASKAARKICEKEYGWK